MFIELVSIIDDIIIDVIINDVALRMALIYKLVRYKVIVSIHFKAKLVENFNR